MNDYILIDLRAKLPADAMIDSLQNSFPEFSWRRGDSEHEGKHIHGENAEHVKFQIWYEDTPPGGYISFRAAWLDLSDREERKVKMYDSISQRLSPAFDVVKAKVAENGNVVNG